MKINPVQNRYNNTNRIAPKTIPRQKDVSQAVTYPSFCYMPIFKGANLTKMYEEVVGGSIAEVMQYFAQNEPRGEFVLMIAPPTEREYQIADVREILQKRLGETSLKTAVKEICAQYGLNKNEVYDLALELKNE